MNLRESSEGSPAPLGATWAAVEQAWNFALYSEHAKRVTLLVYGAHDLVNPVLSYEFDRLRNKTNHVWHARISAKEIPGARFYAYTVDGPRTSAQNAFRPEKILLDPYATSVFLPPAYDRAFATGRASNAGKALLGILERRVSSFDWGSNVQSRDDHDLIIYELHVRGFTANPNSLVSEMKRGTFAGVIGKIPYLRELGITAVELMPVFEFDDTEPNYWGYMPINFFSPHNRYASNPMERSVADEFREMVKALHQAGIEVILDVVYNHTGEGNEQGPTFSFKGIDNETYYMQSPDRAHPYADYSGTGNTLNCAHPAVRHLILESLRYWVREMHVDGFRFDLASVFARDSCGRVDFNEPAIFSDIASDPDLANVRLIAEPWEGNAQYPNYELGVSAVVTGDSVRCCCETVDCKCPSTPVILQRSFPGMAWRQWNDRYRNTLRHFMKGDSGLVGDLMTRIYGSSDVFPDEGPNPCRSYQSLNYVDSHDGPTLYDLVAYNSEESWNCEDRDGEEEVSEEVMRLRKRQVKNSCCLLMLSNGTPMFRAGDEFLQTQFGQRNPWNIDGKTTWLDWDRLNIHKDIFRFFQKMVAFRKTHPSIARSAFWRDDVRWHGVGAQPDLSYDSHSLAFCLVAGSEQDDDLYVMINAYWEPLNFTVQEGRVNNWRKVIDTSEDSPLDFCEPQSVQPLKSPVCSVSPRSVVVLVRPRARREKRAAAGSRRQRQQRKLISRSLGPEVRTGTEINEPSQPNHRAFQDTSHQTSGGGMN